MYATKTIVRIIIASILISLCIGTLSLRQWIKKQSALLTEQQKPHKAAPWMTVWVHGSFATTLGLISVFNVIKDKVKKTNYKKMTRLMRKDPFFFQLQPLQDLGLHPVNPTFDATNASVKAAIYPVAAAYQAMSEQAHREPESNSFYTFGWSGLISQYRRRKEAIELYASLVTEYEALTTRGIMPKVRLIAHSHGGNLALNLAGIHELLQKGMNNEPTAERYPDADQLQSMIELHKLLKSYKKPLPTVAPFHIDELIMLGTPIQPETISFCLSPLFKKIYNIYSDDDVIQSMDWVSTRRYYSEKRIALTPINDDQPIIIQLKLTLNKPKLPVSDIPSTAQTDAPQQSTAAPEIPPLNAPVIEPINQTAKEPAKITTASNITTTLTSLWGRMFGSTTRAALDPLHKELWFMGWKAHDKQALAQQHIQPYPYAILIPYLQKLTHHLPSMRDLDIHLKFTPENISLTAYKHDSTKKEKKVFINASFLNELQAHAKAWQPDNVTPSYEMELLHRYSKMLES